MISCICSLRRAGDPNNARPIVLPKKCFVNRARAPHGVSADPSICINATWLGIVAMRGQDALEVTDPPTFA